MDQPSPFPNFEQNVALIGNYLPRRCGIATFTTDLLQALGAESAQSNIYAVVMNDIPEGYDYPHQVRFEVKDKHLPDYQLAADFLNVSQVGVVSLQHEFGIYGGKYGKHILSLLQSLRMPVVTTLHTVLTEPNQGQKAVIEEIGQISERLVVMSHRAETILREVYEIPAEKIVMIPHGIPDLPFIDPNFFKEQFGVEGRKVILTFGLLSPAKGVEDVIDALPAIVRKHPEAVYIVLGETHPHVLKDQGESYRLSLQRRARELGMESNIIFHNRFVELKELCEFLGVSDVYVTPYLNREQAVSGTLAYALGAGKATISTPYWYAEELLADGRGRIVPFSDPEALAGQVIDLLDNETERHAIRKRAYSFCRKMIWKEVARSYLNLFQEIKEQRLHHPSIPFQRKSPLPSPLEMPRPKFDHLHRLTDDVGILQHAKFVVPDRDHGYCTDDNARALIAVVMARDFVADNTMLLDLDCRYLSFLYHAFNAKKRRFRNFLGYDRKWREEIGSEDSHGRAIWSLGLAIAFEESKGISDVALDLFKEAVLALLDFHSPRAWAFGLVGIHAYLRRFGGDSEVKRVRESLAKHLFDLYRANAAEDWPWIENQVNYDNGKIPQALIMSGKWLQDAEMLETGLRSLEWLIKIQTDSRGHFMPIGNQGWFSRSGEKARFDQQPLEAQSILEACLEAYRVTKDEKWTVAAHCCLDWFLGRNDVNVALYDYQTGGCCDGLTADGANRNQGAESTLAWLLSLMQLYSGEEMGSEQGEAETIVSTERGEKKQYA